MNAPVIYLPEAQADVNATYTPTNSDLSGWESGFWHNCKRL